MRSENHQASLLDQLPAKHEIFTEPLCDRDALRPGLVKIWITRTNPTTGEVIRFALPVQWEAREAADLLQEIRGLHWQLADDGLPGDYEGIRDVCHNYLYKKVGFVEPISVK